WNWRSTPRPRCWRNMPTIAVRGWRLAAFLTSPSSGCSLPTNIEPGRKSMSHNIKNRRTILKGAGSAALLTAARSLVPGGAWAATADAPETTSATLGFIALTDSSPLIIAKEKGLFARFGMPDVKLAKQATWSTTRDNIELGGGHGGIDGAHILTPMPYLISAGKVTKSGKLPMNILARLNTNGQAISVAKAYL